MKKTYFLSYDFYGDKVTKDFTTLSAFVMWLNVIEEDEYIVNASIDFWTEIK